MASNTEEPSGQLFGRMTAGDRDAAQKLWERFFSRLLGLANKTLAGRMNRISDADDAVQSAFVSFWQRAERGDFTDEQNTATLWSLLSVITVRKALKHLARERAQKRGAGKVLNESTLNTASHRHGPGFQLDNALGQVPTHDFNLHCEELLLGLDEESRGFAVLKLLGYTNRDVGAILECHERTVERRLQSIRQKWEQVLDV